MALAASGYLTNSSSISGITSIAIVSDQALTLTYWWSSEDSAVTEPLAANGTVTFAENHPSYFKLTASGATVITSLTIKYTCAAESDPAELDDNTVENCTVEYDSDSGTYHVVRGPYTNLPTFTSAHIPTYYDDGTHGKRPVTAIEEKAFYLCAYMSTVNIPSTVTTIGMGAFYQCYSLNNVTLPSGLTTIGATAFDDCRALTSITIPSSVTSMGQMAFSFCTALTSVTFEETCSLTTLASMVFMNCTALPAIDIPLSVTTIESQAFSTCTSLASVTYSGTLDQWEAITQGSQAFNGVPAEHATCTGGEGGELVKS
jgi:hypothetical protein